MLSQLQQIGNGFIVGKKAFVRGQNGIETDILCVLLFIFKRHIGSKSFISEILERLSAIPADPRILVNRHALREFQPLAVKLIMLAFYAVHKDVIGFLAALEPI